MQKKQIGWKANLFADNENLKAYLPSISKRQSQLFKQGD
jgi:hypothetical protein